METRILLEILLGPQGLRAGWSVLLFTILFFLFFGVAGMVLAGLNLIDPKDRFTASASLFSELAPFLGMVAAAAIVALVERRRGNLLAFNLTGPRSLLHFLEGLVAGFAALSVLIGALAWGGWLHFGPIALSGSQILKFAALWAIAFLLVGCVEEGHFPLLPAIHSDPRHQLLVGAGHCRLHLPGPFPHRQRQRHLGSLHSCRTGPGPVPPAPSEQDRGFELLAGRLGNVHPLRLYPHQQQRRKLDRHLCRRGHRLYLRGQRSGYRLRRVGHWLPTPHGTGPKPTSTAQPTAATWPAATTSPPHRPVPLSGAAAPTGLKGASWSWARSCSC